MKQMKVDSVRMPSDLLKRVKAYARRRKLTKSKAYRDLLEKGLK